MHWITLHVAALTAFWCSPASSAEIYTGEPLAEATYTLVKNGAISVADEMANSHPLGRTDVFLLKDGRLVAVTSTARKAGDAYTITTLRVTVDHPPRLSPKLPQVASVQFPGTD
jgi:hypothetical protein